ncbi:MAG TPA: glucose 1-dehydrogenase [Chloroflexota bacterium]|jgi:3-oxoacyl-[acyl-carrier protein] reductase
MSALLDGKVVVVTGGGHGIGHAYCLGIAREGGKVAVADLDGPAAERVAGEVQRAGGEALAVETDVVRFSSCQDMARRTLDRFGQIDGLVNNAAIFLSVPLQRGGFQDISEEEWDRVMAVNVKGVWLCTRAVVPSMQARKQGSIVNISSTMVFNGSLGMPHYVVSKAAVFGYTRVLARELGPDNIRVNTLAPGLTQSEEHPTAEALKAYDAVAARSILRRVELPDDLVGTALYLLSDLSAFVTGQAIMVNGGRALY